MASLEHVVEHGHTQRKISPEVGGVEVPYGYAPKRPIWRSDRFFLPLRTAFAHVLGSLKTQNRPAGMKEFWPDIRATIFSGKN